MFRLRRYRVFVICALVMLFLLWRATHNSPWDHGSAPAPEAFSRPNQNPPPPQRPAEDVGRPKEDPAEKELPRERPQGESEEQEKGPAKGEGVKVPALKTAEGAKGAFGRPTKTLAPVVDEDPAGAEEDAAQTLAPEMPQRRPGGVEDVYRDEDGKVHLQRPHKGPLETTSSSSQIHWQPVTKYYPIPEASLITLPTGAPKPIPKIQFQFKAEDEAAKTKREERLNMVKGEMKHAWAAYRKYAWGHDEVMPVTKNFRDPFCGWAATLVDSLDTLWIMGMKDEFDDAVMAVKDIDFTFSPSRVEIPVFETTIRYLGGLLAAFDVSGGHEGKYGILLQKATELAEILMGIFDTPNHMPVLYYGWQPAYASQPKRAGASVSVAELGSLSMEFTRLAQVTGEHKYYDAVARITDAFEDWQKRGTLMPGIFPEHIDASECKSSAPGRASESPKIGSWEASRPGADEEQQSSGPGVRASQAKRDLGAIESRHVDTSGPAEEDGMLKTEKGYEEGQQVEKPSIPEQKVPTKPGPVDFRERPPNPSMEDLLVHDCEGPNLTSAGYGYEPYSMGGSQDSTYEYFPKQFLLLGALEPKYQTMHTKVIEAVKKHLLFRPMTPDGRDVRFAAKAMVSTSGRDDGEPQLDYEVTHLACFLGGMFALGGRAFGRDGDVDLGAKLADGCVWAYESTPSGIMPEMSFVVPCAGATDTDAGSGPDSDPDAGCAWDEARWWEALDPSAARRDQQLHEWELAKEQRRARRKQAGEDARRTAAEEQRRREEEEEALRGQGAADVRVATEAQAGAAAARKPAADGSGAVAGRRVSGPPRRQDEAAIHKRDDLEGREASPPAQRPQVETVVSDEVQNGDMLADTVALDSATATKTRDGTVAAEKWGQIPINEAGRQVEDEENDDDVDEDLYKPLSHEEYVQNKLANERIPPGFASIPDKRYILRPEAIESVWYMYRITGDGSWQEKGWRMFESVVAATRTEAGHSAIADVLLGDNNALLDNMESFWPAETLKYFYLLFAPPDVVSLDDWVLNTEAHPFRRPTGPLVRTLEDVEAGR